MTKSFRSGVYRKMFAAGGDLKVFSVSLQTLDKANTKTACQIGILSVCFMAPPPSWVTENIDIRAPHGKTFINIPVIMTALAVVFGSCFTGNHGRNFFLCVFIKHGGESDCLRKYGCCTGSCNSVQYFIPPVIGRNSEPGNSRCVISELGCSFFNRHLGDKLSGFRCCIVSVSHFPVSCSVILPVRHELFTPPADKRFPTFLFY